MELLKKDIIEIFFKFKLPEDNSLGLSIIIFSGICGFNGKYIDSCDVRSSISRQI